MWKYNSIYLIKLIEHFERLPGIGKKSARRLAYHVLGMPKEDAKDFAEAILEAQSKVKYCKVCCSFTDKDVCEICSNSARDESIVCVVEDSRDIEAIERTGEFDGLYHVLHGVISPLNAIGPDEIKILELIKRVREGKIKEIIMATNPTVEGEATSMYISKLLANSGVKITRLAYGIPIGATLEYADEVTLSRAIAGRNEITKSA